MRRIAAEPSSADFLTASEYEASTPAAFGLPELPVLYEQRPARSSGRDACIWVASNGLYMWSGGTGFVADLESVHVVGQRLEVDLSVLELDSGAAAAVERALARAAAFNAALGAAEDNVELAVPVDYESGQADDLGDARLEQSVGAGLSLTTGPAIAAKRRRPS